MAPRHVLVVAALAMLLLLCGPDLVASRSLLEDCGKCNVPVDKGGCKCDANCACLLGGQPAPPAGGGGGKCDKCNVPENAGGCKCDANCDCLAKSAPAPPPPPAPPAKAPYKEIQCERKVGLIDGKGCIEIMADCIRAFECVGRVCMGQCYRFFGGCQIGHCNKGTPADRCNEYLPDQCQGKC